jgi:predicted transcriptional regulator of viral defense system
MSNKQKEILKLFSPRGLVVSKKDIVTVYGSSYYCNAEKYIGEILSRMVKNGMLERVKPGFFKLGPGPEKKKVVEDKNQMTLF